MALEKVKQWRTFKRPGKEGNTRNWTEHDIEIVDWLIGKVEAAADHASMCAHPDQHSTAWWKKNGDAKKK